MRGHLSLPSCWSATRSATCLDAGISAAEARPSAPRTAYPWWRRKVELSWDMPGVGRRSKVQGRKVWERRSCAPASWSEGRSGHGRTCIARFSGLPVDCCSAELRCGRDAMIDHRRARTGESRCAPDVGLDGARSRPPWRASDAVRHRLRGGGPGHSRVGGQEGCAVSPWTCVACSPWRGRSPRWPRCSAGTTRSS